MDKRVVKAIIAEERVLIRLIRKGYMVFKPVSHHTPIDLIAIKKQEIIRIQVKSVKLDNGVFKVKLKSTNGYQVIKYTAEDIDSVFAVDQGSKNIYNIPSDKFEGRGQLNLRIAPTKSNQQIGVNYARDYLYPQ